MTGAISTSLLRAFVDFTRASVRDAKCFVGHLAKPSCRKSGNFGSFRVEGIGDPRRTVDRRHSRNH